jgi:predicted dehydrogenase
VSADRLRVAVVGAGLMGRLHARVVFESRETQLVAIVDSAPAAEETARARSARWFATVDDVLAAEQLDMAIVSVPTVEHARIARPLLEAGIAVLVEKPITSTLAEARELVAAASAAGVPLAVGHVERHNAAVKALHTRLEQGALGRVFQVHARRLSPFPARIGDTGVVHDLATHDLDVMCTLAGDPIRVSAELDRKAHRTREDLLAAVMRFDSGAVGVLEVNWLTPTKVRQLSVTGERGMFVVDYLNQHLSLFENAQTTEHWETLAIFDGVAEGNVTRFAIEREEPLQAQLNAFVAAVRGEAPVAVSGEDGIRVLEVALAVIEAGTTNRTLELAPHGVTR